VPAETTRLSRRLGARDRRFLTVFACAVVASIPIGLVLAHRDSGGTPSHCVSVQGVGFMGGGSTQYCGAAADARCKNAEAHDTALVAQCRKIGD
jgi:hypothetical protein